MSKSRIVTLAKYLRDAVRDLEIEIPIASKFTVIKDLVNEIMDEINICEQCKREGAMQ